MKKFAVIAAALAVLAMTPALAQENQSSSFGPVQPGYYNPSQVPSGNVPFAPF